MSELVYTIYITNNHALFQLWLKENLIKNQKVLKYCDHYCQQNFLFLIMFLLTAPIGKFSHVLIYLMFLNKRSRPNWKGFQY